MDVKDKDGKPIEIGDKVSMDFRVHSIHIQEGFVQLDLAFGPDEFDREDIPFIPARLVRRAA